MEEWEEVQELAQKELAVEELVQCPNSVNWKTMENAGTSNKG